MARSARELFEEALRLDAEERATLMRLLIDTPDANRTRVSRMPGASRSSAGWRTWTRARSRQFPRKSLERGCTDAEWLRPPSGFHPAAAQEAEEAYE
jgi:hypothetical protein